MRKEQILLKDFLEFRYLSDLKSNPSETRAAYVVAVANEEANEYHRTIHVTDGKSTKQMTYLNKEGSFEWLNDSTLLFMAKRLPDEEKQKDETTIYALSLDGGEAKPAYQIPINVSQIKVVSETELLLTSTISLEHPDYFKYDRKQREKVQKDKEENEAFVEIDELPFWFDGSRYINKTRTRLFHFDAKTKKLTPLTKPELSVENLTLSYDKQKAYFVANATKNIPPKFDTLFELDIKTKKVTKLRTNEKIEIYGIAPLTDGLYLFANDGKTLGAGQNPRLYKLEGERLTRLSEEISLGSSIGSDVRLGSGPQLIFDGRKITFITTIDGHARVEQYENGKHSILFEDENTAVDEICRLDGKLLSVALVEQKLQDLYELENNKALQLTHHNTSLDNKKVIRPVKLSFESNGDEISGWVLLPPEFEKKKKVPAILDIHGGPKTAYGSVYYHEMQVWANLGYVVFYCNPHGSDGKGDAFSDIRGKYGTIDYEDIMNFTDLVLSTYPKIDKDNVGVTGGSYGGFMTNWIVGHTNRFKAAATQRSITNWMSFYGVSDIGYYFADDQNAADMFTLKGQQKYWDRSPLKYAKNFKTPTLIIHSTADYRCPIDQGYQLFSALKVRNIDSKMVIFKDETHELSRSGKPKGRIKRLTEITEWFNRYLK